VASFVPRGRLIGFGFEPAANEDYSLAVLIPGTARCVFPGR
jgi:hypothetical protein